MRHASHDPRVKQFSELPSMTWEKRKQAIYKVFPELDWSKAFAQDIDLMGAILKDIVKSDQVIPGKPGPRPSLDRVLTEHKVDALLGKDPTERPYTSLPYKDALALLSGNHSLIQVARKIGTSKTQAFRLLRGEVTPDLSLIEQTALGYGKQPSYFIEYRTAHIMGYILNQLDDDPEFTIKFYESLFV